MSTDPNSQDTDPQSTVSEAERSLVPFQQQAEIEHERGRGLVLVVDSDQEQADETFFSLQKMGYVPHLANQGEAAIEFVTKYPFDLVITELGLEGFSGFDVLRQIRQINPFLAVMVLTSEASVENCVEAMKLGAADFVSKPLGKEGEGGTSFALFKGKVRAAIEGQRMEAHRQRSEVARTNDSAFDEIIQISEKMSQVINLCLQVAETDATVLITGESGTGKELIAKAIHKASLRKDQRFVPINCAALSANIIESELFGHEKGSFTGATQSKKGFFEHSDGGTIFLDEVGDIPLETQVKLLRVLENREIIRVGANDPIPVNVRVLSATHRNLEELVEEGAFREDLYYRLKVVTVRIPPLRERPQDIPLLAKVFFTHYSELYNRRFTNIQRDALFALMAHRWKGNVRELKHTIENLVVTAPGPEITYTDLPETIRLSRQEPAQGETTIESLVGLPIKDVEKELIRHTLKNVNGNRYEAAKILGIGERTLYRKLKAYDLS